MKMDSHDQEIQDKFGFGNQLDNINKIKLIKDREKVREYGFGMYQSVLELLDVVEGKTVISISNKVGEIDTENAENVCEFLDDTRKKSIEAVKKYLGKRNEKLKYLIQFVLFYEDGRKNLRNMDTLYKALESKDVDYILLAWGEEAHIKLTGDSKERCRMKKALKENIGKILWVNNHKKYPAHIIRSSYSKVELLNDLNHLNHIFE